MKLERERVHRSPQSLALRYGMNRKALAYTSAFAVASFFSLMMALVADYSRVISLGVHLGVMRHEVNPWLAPCVSYTCFGPGLFLSKRTPDRRVDQPLSAPQRL